MRRFIVLGLAGGMDRLKGLDDRGSGRGSEQFGLEDRGWQEEGH